MKTIRVKIIILLIVFISFTLENNCSVSMRGDLDYDSLKIDSKLTINFNYNDPNNITIEFKNYDHVYDRFNGDSFSFGDIFYQTYHDIPENHGYMSGKAFLILSNGTKIQTHDIKLNSDSTFEVYSIKHTLNANSPILEMTEFTVKKIEFEVYYFHEIEDNMKLISTKNEIGVYKADSPLTFSTEFAEFIDERFGLTYIGPKIDLLLSEKINDGDCDFEEDWSIDKFTFLKRIRLEFVADPKKGMQLFDITSIVNIENVFRITIYNDDPSSSDLISLKLIGENDDVFEFQKFESLMDKHTKMEYYKPVDYQFEDKILLSSFEKLNIKSVEVVTYEYVAMDKYKEGRRSNAILTKDGRSQLTELKMFFACLIMKINSMKENAQRNTKR